MNSKLFKPLNEQIQVVKIKRQGITDSERDLLIESIINDNAVEVLTEDLNTVSFYEDLNNDSLDEVIFEGMDIYDLIDYMEEQDVTLDEAFDIIDNIYNHTISLEESVLNENKSISAYDLMLLEGLLDKFLGAGDKKIEKLRQKNIKRKSVKPSIGDNDSKRTELKQAYNKTYNRSLDNSQAINSATRELARNDRKAALNRDLDDIAKSGSKFAKLKGYMAVKKWQREEAKAIKRQNKEDKKAAIEDAKKAKKDREKEIAVAKSTKTINAFKDREGLKTNEVSTPSERDKRGDMVYTINQNKADANSTYRKPIYDNSEKDVARGDDGTAVKNIPPREKTYTVNQDNANEKSSFAVPDYNSDKKEETENKENKENNNTNYTSYSDNSNKH